MPRSRRRAKSRLAPLTREQWEEVTDGLDSPLYDGRPSAFETPLLKRAAWVEHRDKITAEYERTHEPYERPSCWWLFDAPREPRRVVAPQGDGPWPIFVSDIPYLMRHGLATPIEIAYLAELRQENAARPEHARQHEDAVGACTMRPLDWRAA